VRTLEAYVSAHKDVMDGLVEVEVPGFAMKQGVWLGEGATVHPDAVVEGFAIIGENSRIEAGVRIGDYTVLGSNVRLRTGTELERSVVHDNAFIDTGVRLRGAVVGRSADIRRNVSCDSGSVIGDECFIGADA